jgi:hypothetical protein
LAVRLARSCESMTYLGHKDIQSTLVYLNMTPELLQRSTAVYLKLATEDLRSVALEVPAGVSPRTRPHCWTRSSCRMPRVLLRHAPRAGRKVA